MGATIVLGVSTIVLVMLTIVLVILTVVLIMLTIVPALAMTRSPSDQIVRGSGRRPTVAQRTRAPP